MEKLVTTFAVALSILFTVLLPIKTANAGGYGVHLGYGNYGGHYGIDYGHHNQHNHHGNYSPGYSQNSYNQGYNPSGHYANYPAQRYSHQARPCHQVSKYTYDEYGNAHKIGGTMCYNNYGEGYVVEGSRYEIR